MLVLSLYALVRQLSLVLEDMLVLQVVRAVLVARAVIFRSMVVLAVPAVAVPRRCSVAVAARHRAAACRLRLLMAGARVAVARCRWARAHRVVEQAALCLCVQDLPRLATAVRSVWLWVLARVVRVDLSHCLLVQLLTVGAVLCWSHRALHRAKVRVEVA